MHGEKNGDEILDELNGLNVQAMPEPIFKDESLLVKQELAGWVVAVKFFGQGI